MKKRLVLVGVGMLVAGIIAALFLFPFDPVTVTHAQTPVVLPITGAGGAGGGGIEWWWLLVAGFAAMIMAVGLVIAGRRQRAPM